MKNSKSLLSLALAVTFALGAAAVSFAAGNGNTSAPPSANAPLVKSTLKPGPRTARRKHTSKHRRNKAHATPRQAKAVTR